jgi:hypothetical protein
MPNDPLIARYRHNQTKLARYRRLVARNRALGLTVRGTVPKRHYTRDRHPNFINPYAPPKDQREQQQRRRAHNKKYFTQRYHRLAAERLALGLTTKGKPRQRNKISPIEQAWRQFRTNQLLPA